MPRLRATSISSLVSIVNVTSPSTSAASSPASSSAASTASHASCSSVRPDSFENSVWPMPAIAARPASRPRHGAIRPERSSVAVPPTCSPSSFIARNSTSTIASSPSPLDRGHVAGVRQRVAREHRHAEADREPLDHRVGPGPVGEEAAAVAGVGEDVHEDVGRALLVRVVAVVVHRHEVARRDRAGDDHASASRRSPSAGARRRRASRASRSSRAARHAVASGRNRGRTRPSSNCVEPHLRPACRSTRRRARRRTRLRHEPGALLELDERDDVAVLEERQRRVARHHEAVARSRGPTPRSCPTRAQWQCGHIGRGGWRSVAHAPQRWISSRRSFSAVPEELGVGRHRRREAEAHESAPSGVNLRMRNVCRPTTSPARIACRSSPT